MVKVTSKRFIAMFLAIFLCSSITVSATEIDTTKQDVEIQVKNSEKALVGEKYEEASQIIVQSYAQANEEDEKTPELIVKEEEAKDIKLLKMKTEANYEIALASSDGSYSFLNSSENLEGAIDQAKAQEKSRNTSDSTPVVIDSRGQVVYATSAMGRVYKHINKKPYDKVDKNTSLYSDAGLSRESGYINHGYCSDVPILSDNGTSAKIMISNFEGWINKNTNSNEYDLLVVPMSQVVNPSYYYVQNGELYHYISTNVTKVGSGTTNIISKAPSYLVQGKKYFSYDGTYFYDGSNVQTGMDKLTRDYSANTRANSVNANNPFSAYFNQLSVRSKSVYTAEELDRYIVSNTNSNSKLRGLGQAFKNAESQYGVNSVLALAVAINESNWGMSEIAQTKNNIFGLGAVDSNPGEDANSFHSVEDSVYNFAKNWISSGYCNPSDWRYNGSILGNKKNGINVRYASDPYWGEKATKYAYSIDKNLGQQDYDNNQIGTVSGSSNVINSSGQVLYTTNINRPFVVSKKDKVTIAGKQYYEIYPDRMTTAGKYPGDYDWITKGYIPATSTKFINTGKNNILPQLKVLGGANRYDTSVEISKGNFSQADTVMIVNGYAEADGLTSAPLGAHLRAPLLFSEKNSMPTSVINEIKRLGAKNAIIVGGTGIVSENVVKQLKAIGVNNVTRLGGINRYDTSLKVAQYIDQKCYDVENVVITNGYGEADALSVAPIAGSSKMPIILSEKSSLPSNINKWLKVEGLKNAYIIGGTGVLTDSVLNTVNGMTSQNISGNRLGGKNRYETNAKIIERFYGNNLNSVYVSKGIELVDALSAGPACALVGAPIVLADGDLTYEQKKVLEPKSANMIIQAGKGINQIAINNLRDYLKK